MRTSISNLKTENTAFIGDYDSYTIENHHYDKKYLERITKIGLLLFKKILLPAAFFWQSQELESLISSFSPAIEEDILLPVIRDYSSTTDIKDYYERRLEESGKISQNTLTNDAFKSELATANNKKTAEVLNEYKKYVHVDGKSVKNIFMNKWVSDISYNSDFNSIRLLLYKSGIRDDKLDIVTTSLLTINGAEVFSRKTCSEVIENILAPNRQLIDKLINRTSYIYLKATAEAYESSFYCTYDPYNGSIGTTNISLFSRILKLFGLDYDFIDKLSISEIVKIRNSQEYKVFIIKYLSIINEMKIEEDRIYYNLEANFIREFKSESENMRIIKLLNCVRVMSVEYFMGVLVELLKTSDFSSVAQLIWPSGVVAIAGGTAAILQKKFDNINKAFDKMALLDFKEYMIRNYKAKVDKRLK